MERINNDLSLFHFDVEGYQRAYSQRSPGQQSEHARQRTSFEEQLGKLKPSSSDESSGEDGSPDALSGEYLGGVRRDMGASMRTPPRFASSDSSSNSSRHSVDIPDPVSSLEIQTKNGKNPGLWSRIKSAVGVSSSGSRSKKAFGAPKQQEVVSTNIQVYHAKSPYLRNVFEQDEERIALLQTDAFPDLSKRSLATYRTRARNFSAWLNTNGRLPFANRLGNKQRVFDPDLEKDFIDYKKTCDDSGYELARLALRRLWNAQLRNLAPPRPNHPKPYPADANLINRRWDAEKEKGTPQTTRSDHTRRLNEFSGWLRTNNRGAMADRLSTPGLTQDVKEYAKTKSTTKTKSTKSRTIERLLCDLQAYKEKCLAWQELPPPMSASQEDWNQYGEYMQEPASWPPADLGPQPGSSYELAPFPASASDGDWNQYGEYMQEPASWPPADLGPQPGSSYELAPFPASASDGDWNQYGEYMQQPAPYPWSAPSNFYDGVQPPFDMTTPYVMNDYAPGHAGQRDEAGPSHQGVVDLGHLIPGGWEHYERWLPDNLTQALDQHLMPAPGRPTYFNIQGVPYMAALVEKDGRPRVRIYPEFG